MPTVALVAMTDGESFWSRISGQEVGRLEQLTIDRVEDMQALSLTRHWWGRKVAAAHSSWADKWVDSVASTHGPSQWLQSEEVSARVYNLERFDAVWVGQMYDGFAGYRRRFVLNDDGEQVREIIAESCTPWDWVRNGGDRALATLIADRLVVVASEGLHSEVENVIDAISVARATGQPIPLLTTRPRPVVRYDLANFCPPAMSADEVDRFLGDFAGELEESVRASSWTFDWDREDAARLWILKEDFVIVALPEHHKEIAAFIDAKAATIKSSD